MFHTLGINWTERELAQHYSPNWLRVYRAARLPRSKWIEADRLWTRAYKSENPPLLAGARRVVRLLARKFELGIVTSGNRPRVRRQLREFDLAELFFRVRLQRGRREKEAASGALAIGAEATAPRSGTLRVRRRHGGRHRNGSQRRRARHRCSRPVSHRRSLARCQARSHSEFSWGTPEVFALDFVTPPDCVALDCEQSAVRRGYRNARG